MVLCNIANIERYYALNPLIKAGIDYLNKNLNAPAGRYEVVGDDCFLLMVDGTKRSKSEAKLEVHDKYIDVQVVLDGHESFGYKARKDCAASSGAFDEGSDIGFFEDAPTTYIDAVAGDALIFFPEDGHAPLVGEGKVRKAILKIKA